MNLASNNIQSNPEVIAVSKTFGMDKIIPLIEYGHEHFGENKVQEAITKWEETKKKKNNLKLHLIGRLQTNKVKFAVKLFDYIHSLDNEKLAKKISDEQNKQNCKPKLFIQINLGEEVQKSGIPKKDLSDFKKYCEELNLNIIGIMCLPPFDEDPEKYFQEMRDINSEIKFKDLSMGMSSDYLKAIKYNSTFLRLGSSIFGERS